MKKIVFLFSALAFISLNFTSSFAQEDLTTKVSTMSADPGMAKSVEYELPYPGMLPDNPLYFLKMIRDRIVGFLISDPLKKAEFDLLQADKRLNAGVYLLDKNKDVNGRLAQSTISKGEDYFEQAIEKAKEAKTQGLDTKDILRRLSASSDKHQDILQSLGDNASKNLRDDYIFLQKRAKDSESRVESLRPE
jgi:hypothetical protein